LTFTEGGETGARIGSLVVLRDTGDHPTPGGCNASPTLVGGAFFVALIGGYDMCQVPKCVSINLCLWRGIASGFPGMGHRRCSLAETVVRAVLVVELHCLAESVLRLPYVRKCVSKTILVL
jgi:hypothetical protein